MDQAENSGLGSHLLADLCGVESVFLKDETQLMERFGNALESAGFKVLQRLSYRFPDSGEGVTGMFLLTESHLTFHTYPEHGYLALDLFSCGGAKPELVVARVLADFSPTRSEISVHRRGERVSRVRPERDYGSAAPAKIKIVA